MKLNANNIDRFCSKIDLQNERPLIDLSKLEFIEPFAVIYLGQFIRFHNRNGKYFDVELPREGSRVREYIARIRFWDRFNFNSDMVRQEGMLRLTSDTSFNDIVELIPDKYVDEDVVPLAACG